MGILPHVLGSRLVTACALFVAVLSGAAPWRVSLASECAHGGVWLPLGACAEHSAACARTGHGARTRTDDGSTHGNGAGRHAHDGCPCGHSHKAPAGPERSAPPEAPTAPEDNHCHCSDQPLLTGAPLAPVALEAPALAGWTADVCPPPLAAFGASEVARCEHDAPRVACEEDSIVLLR